VAPIYCASDGENIWTTTGGGGQVYEVQASTGILLATLTGAANGVGILVAEGIVFVAGQTSPGTLYYYSPQIPGTSVTVLATNLGNDPNGIAFDGTNIWTANRSGSVSIISLQTPFAVTTLTTGFSDPFGILYDGAHMWVTDSGAGTLLKLDSSGNILQTVIVGSAPGFPVFDGANIWVPNNGSNTVTVVQASTGNVVASIGDDATIGLDAPIAAAFDGERVLVTNAAGSVTVFKAADLSVIADVVIGASTFPYGACSDGINFWLALDGASLLRF
jgi:hypothetical protein